MIFIRIRSVFIPTATHAIGAAKVVVSCSCMILNWRIGSNVGVVTCEGSKEVQPNVFLLIVERGAPHWVDTMMQLSRARSITRLKLRAMTKLRKV